MIPDILQEIEVVMEDSNDIGNRMEKAVGSVGDNTCFS